MMSEDHNSTGTAPARARTEEELERSTGNARHRAADRPASSWQPAPGSPHEPPFEAHPVPDDLRVPWGWFEVAIFAVLGIVGAYFVTWGIAQIAIRFWGVTPGQVFGTTMSTTKSLVVLISQALIDTGAILFLCLMVLTRTPEPFWRSIGWREMRHGMGTIRESALQLLAGGALLAVAVSFIGGFLNPKGPLPIEELLKARVSILLFGVLGVLVAPVVEETIFRGFLYPVVARRFGITLGIVITGTLFGLMHAAQLWGGWGQIALLIFVGLVLTWVRARTGTVAASYLIHLGYNGLQLVGYLIFLIGGGHH
jgi:membrane protease YdiL (CAAX protease family)